MDNSAIEGDDDGITPTQASVYISVSDSESDTDSDSSSDASSGEKNGVANPRRIDDEISTPRVISVAYDESDTDTDSDSDANSSETDGVTNSSHLDDKSSTPPAISVIHTKSDINTDSDSDANSGEKDGVTNPRHLDDETLTPPAISDSHSESDTDTDSDSDAKSDEIDGVTNPSHLEDETSTPPAISVIHTKSDINTDSDSDANSGEKDGVTNPRHLDDETLTPPAISDSHSKSDTDTDSDSDAKSGEIDGVTNPSHLDDETSTPPAISVIHTKSDINTDNDSDSDANSGKKNGVTNPRHSNDETLLPPATFTSHYDSDTDVDSNSDSDADEKDGVANFLYQDDETFVEIQLSGNSPTPTLPTTDNSSATNDISLTKNSLELEPPMIVYPSYNRSISTFSVKDPIILYRRRWLVLFLFSLCTMMNEVIWVSLSSVATTVQVYYNVSNDSVNWLAMVFSAMYVTVVIAVAVLNRWGLRVTIVTGAMCNAVASWFRFAGHTPNGFKLAFVGNIVGGIGQSFLLFVPPTLSAVWFGEKERATASSIGMLMNMFGVAVGFLMGSMFVHKSDPGKGMYTTLLIQAIVSSVLLITCAVLLKASPPTPPTHSQASDIKRREHKERQAAAQASIDRRFSLKRFSSFSSLKSGAGNDLMQSTGFLKNWRKLATNTSFHCLSQAYSLYFGLFVTTTTLLEQMVDTIFHGKSELIGIMGFTSTLCGLVSLMLAGLWIDRTHRYKLLSIVVFIGCVVTLVLFTVVLTYVKNFPATFVCFCLYGFFFYPYLSVGLEHTAEIMYPIKESILSFVIISVGTIYGIVFTYVGGVVIRRAGAGVAGFVFAGLYVVGLVCVVMVKGRLKRLMVDSKDEQR